MARVLIVDDDGRVAEYLRAHLQDSGHHCLVANSGEQALATVHRTELDLLVLDVMLPGGISGFEVCRRIRADSEINFLPILLLSAMSGPEEIMHGLAQGADDYMTKPFDLASFLARVENLLKMSADQRAPDELTALPGSGAMKREVQKRVSRHDAFALVSIELLRLREFAYHCGAEARMKAIRHVARALQLCAPKGRESAVQFGHMGGGYFIGIVEPERAEDYCRRVLAAWNAHLPGLYESLGASKAYADNVERQGSNPIPLLSMLACVTAHHAKEVTNAKEVFEVLTHLRGKALNGSNGGVYVDRRA